MMNTCICITLTLCIKIACVVDAISESKPRVIDDSRARKLAGDLKRSEYHETCATYGLNVEIVFHDGYKIINNRVQTINRNGIKYSYQKITDSDSTIEVYVIKRGSYNLIGYEKEEIEQMFAWDNIHNI